MMDVEMVDDDSTKVKRDDSTEMESYSDKTIDDKNESGGHDVSSNHVEPNDKFKCKLCDECFGLPEIKRHYADTHADEDIRFICDDCGRGFKFESGLMLHREKQHFADSPRTSKRLSRRAQKSPQKLTKEPITHSFVKAALDCELCDRKFRHVSSLTLHIQKHIINRLLMCNSCDQTFLTEQSLKKHLKLHKGLRPYQCYICKKDCGTVNRHVLHMTKHKDEAEYKCDRCPSAFSDASQLAIHMLLHVHDNYYKCSGCKYMFFSEERWEEHKKQHGDHEGGVRDASAVMNAHIEHTNHTCDICCKSFDKIGKLVAHQRVHSTTKIDIHICIECGETFEMKYQLRKHMLTHREEVPHRCCVCPETFQQLDQLEAHISNHTGESLDCFVCGENLTDINDIMVHVRRHKEEGEAMGEDKDGNNVDLGSQSEKYQCNICGKGFHFESSLKSHLHVHQPDQLLKCHLCGEAYMGVKLLREHIKSQHHELSPQEESSRLETSASGKIVVKRNRCDICLEWFISYYRCKAHRMLHTGEKPFRCDVCGSSFVLRSQLKTHQICHSDEKPHVCEVCGKSYKKIRMLREHQMGHTGIKPFMCDTCGKTFVNAGKLRLHTFVHTRETPFNCKVCGRGFRAFVTRQKHQCTGPPGEKDESAIMADINNETPNEREATRVDKAHAAGPSRNVDVNPAFDNFPYILGLEWNQAAQNVHMRDEQYFDNHRRYHQPYYGGNGPC